MRVTCEQHVFRVQETRNVSVVSKNHFACLSLQILLHATKFPSLLNWETSRGHFIHDNIARDMSPSSAGPLGYSNISP